MSTSTTTPTTRRRRLAQLLLATGIAGAATVAIGAGSASAMTMEQWRARCESDGGEWSTYLSSGVRFYECLWINPGGGYSYDVFHGRANNLRFDRSCGGTYRTEYCIDL